MADFNWRDNKQKTKPDIRKMQEHIRLLALVVHPYNPAKFKSKDDWWMAVLNKYEIEYSPFGGQHDLTFDKLMTLWNALLEKEQSEFTRLAEMWTLYIRQEPLEDDQGGQFARKGR